MIEVIHLIPIIITCFIGAYCYAKGFYKDKPKVIQHQQMIWCFLTLFFISVIIVLVFNVLYMLCLLIV